LHVTQEYKEGITVQLSVFTAQLSWSTCDGPLDALSQQTDQIVVCRRCRYSV